MDFKYKNVKKLDFKQWLLGGNSKIYGVILLVTIVAIVVVLTSLGGISDGKSQNESTQDEANETLSSESDATDGTEYIFPHEIYKVMVNKSQNFITVYTMDDSRNYTVVHKQFRCSVNQDVPVQTTGITYKYTWVRFDYAVHGHYSTKLASGIYIHSSPYYNQSVYELNKSAYNNLGNSATMGYIYLCAADAKWIFENCGIDTVVEVYENSDEQNPFANVPLEPATTKYDPTDTEAAANYVPETQAPTVAETESASENDSNSNIDSTSGLGESAESSSEDDTKSDVVSDAESNAQSDSQGSEGNVTESDS